MSDIDTSLQYSDTHMWVRDEGDGVVTVGISDHAQELMGEVVYVDLPGVDEDVAEGEEAGVVESVKAATDLYSPLSGVVIEVNEALEDSPGMLNTDPYGDGWIFKLQLADDAQLGTLLDAESYQSLIEA